MHKWKTIFFQYTFDMTLTKAFLIRLQCIINILIFVSSNMFLIPFFNALINMFTTHYVYERDIMHTSIDTYIHTYIHPYIHTYIHTYIYTYIHTYIHTYRTMAFQVYIIYLICTIMTSLRFPELTAAIVEIPYKIFWGTCRRC